MLSSGSLNQVFTAKRSSALYALLGVRAVLQPDTACGYTLKLSDPVLAGLCRGFNTQGALSKVFISKTKVIKSDKNITFDIFDQNTSDHCPRSFRHKQAGSAPG